MNTPRLLGASPASPLPKYSKIRGIACWQIHLPGESYTTEMKFTDFLTNKKGGKG
jgi:hypothetical protein